MILILCKKQGLAQHVISQIYKQIGLCFKFSEHLSSASDLENISTVVVPENSVAEIDFSLLKKFIGNGGLFLKIGKFGKNDAIGKLFGNTGAKKEIALGKGTAVYVEENLFLEAADFLFPTQKNSGLLGERDKLGRIVGKNSPLFKKGMHNKPHFDEISGKIFAIHENAANKTGTLLVRKWPWPEAKDFAVFVSHDVDNLVIPPHLLFLRALGDMKNLKIDGLLRKTSLCFRYMGAALKSIPYGKIDFTAFLSNVSYENLQNDPWFTIIELAKTEAIAGIKPTFFFLDNCSIKDSTYSVNSEFSKKIMCELNEMDFEIALHSGFYTSGNAEQMELQKKSLENSAGVKIKGVRQHRLIFKYPGTWAIQKNAGFEYDSSCLFNDLAGFSNGTCMPFEAFEYEKNVNIGLLELPVTIMDISLALAQGRNFNYEKALEESKKLAEEVISKNGMLGLLWHPVSFENKRSKKAFESKFDRGLLRGADIFWAILEFVKKRGNAWFATGSEIAEWWKNRSNANVTLKKTNNGYNLDVHSDKSLNGLTLQIKNSAKIKRARVLNDADNAVKIFNKNSDLFIIVKKPRNRLNILLESY